MHTIDLIAQRTSVLPNNLQQEVLDFVEFLLRKMVKHCRVQGWLSHAKQVCTQEI